MSLEIDLSKDRGRPQERTATKTSGEDIHHATRLELVVSLDHDGDELDVKTDFFSADRYAMETVRYIPTGSLLRVVVGRRVMVTRDAVAVVRELKARGVHVLVMAETIESGLAWVQKIDGRGEAA